MSSIMIIEDDESIRDVICEVIEEEGHRAIPAENGREALGILENSQTVRPELILLDMMMPVMDGLAFCAELRNLTNVATIPVVVLSAHADVNEIASSLHVAGSLKKPIRLEALSEVIARFTS